MFFLHLHELAEASDFGVGKSAIRPRLEDSKVERADLDALQLFDQMVEVLEHDADLVLTAFNEAHLVPGVIAFFDELETGGCSFAAVHGNAVAESFLFFVSEGTFDFHQISLSDVAGR